MASGFVKSVRTALITEAVPQTDGLHAVSLDSEGESHSVIVLRRGEEWQAWWNICPHAGRRLDYAPGKFLMQQGQLICAAHGAMFRLDDGECVAGPCRGASLRAIGVRVVDDALEFAWEDDET